MSTTRHLLILTTSLAVATVAKADFFWTGAADSDWNNASNWSPDTAPFNNDRIVNTGTAVVPAGGSTIGPIRDIKVGDGGGTNGIVNNAAGVHSANGWAFISLNGGTGTYNLADTSGSGGTFTGAAMGSGRIVANPGDTGRLYVGYDSGGTAKLNVNTSATSTFDFVIVGQNSTGTLNIDNGTIASKGELWIGQGGTGVATVNQSGGTVTSSSWIAIGRQGAAATYNLTGGTLSHTGGSNTIIGSLDGRGTLEQTGGSFTEVNDLRLGEGASGRGTYNLKGGTASVNGWTIVGWTGGGTGTLNVGGGSSTAVFTSGYVEVGGGAGGAGNGTVNLLTDGVIATRVIARNGGAITGQVNFNGGTFRATESNGEFLPGFNNTNSEILAGGLIVDTAGFDTATGVALDGVGGLTKAGNGTLTLNGVSTFTGKTKITGGILRLGTGGSLSPSSEVTLAGGSLDASAVAGGLVVPVGQTFDGNGRTTGDVTINGTIAPGNSLGTLTIAGNLTLSGTTSMELDPSQSPNSDEIIVISPGTTITYGGALSVTQFGGTFALGQTFDLFDANTFGGSFSSTSLPSLTGLGDGFWYWKDDLATDGSLTILPEPGSSGLFGLAAVAALARRRRK